MTKTVFFEVQDWEENLLRNDFPDSQLIKEKIDVDNAGQFADVELLSSFVYSNLSSEVLQKLQKLKFIATRSTGFDHIDIEYCKKNNIVVANVPEYGSNTVAEHTFALILNLTRKIYQSVNQAKQLNFDHSQIRGIDLYDKTIGIIGLGKIGVNVLRIAHGFGMKILVNTRSKSDELSQKYQFSYTDLETLLRTSDIVTLHLPLNEATKHTINKNNIVLLKKGSYLINTARGGLIDTEALMMALEKNIVAGVALDVLEEEKELNEEAQILSERFREKTDFKTLVLNHILINHPHVLITPHNAFNSVEALNRIAHTTIKNIQGFINNTPINVVNS
ncbi:hypothetical protein A3A93_01735 [Candidatus Roizmanbacteria bacterium RIFCSPLOWO2_01_FULL_38_12]|uniref:Hydroxyacid dehydrogenase n=1 Tax=Candidatus Roizmanbacteria bacterium RIFCSPLOWO2_01_FULL_38_12 TaxID=1802061 RepID=A0A1F7IY96_9BACT|nr:MAG: hypothetical protein A2861_02265 [Candidatus Roizmanbacteria bacterium RIFCSPHIGHO2_01_FULL_38_15]OGK34510.1 MAG: hypothetical protein A3F59_04260 [Candidatus Roizmanbacteria bacterium RIFCSPHIGHO2_12_FULL_38_13]OGK48339.1 MAG: hypothetical protein A3A93_01735 [Candidatus Roizmanbacteria bacterium RIFCSPLOWO2_01_FULL_38_12]